MGFITAEIELTNAEDIAFSRKNIIGVEEIRRMNVRMLVDTGAINMCINENIQEYMQFPLSEHKTFEIATGERKYLPVVEGVSVKFKNRITSCRAVVLPGNSEPLLGAIPLEDLDVIINARELQLEVNPESPDQATQKLYYMRATDKIYI